MKKNTAIFSILSFIFIIGLAAILIKNIGQPAKTSKTDKLLVVASFYPLYFMSAQIGGVKAEVSNIVPAGAEPHDYEPTVRDMAKMENSRLIILNGNGLEIWSDNLKKIIDNKKTKIITAGTELDATTNTDTHTWLAPLLAQKIVDRIAQGLKQADPPNKNYYQANADALKNKLNSLDVAYKQGLTNCAQKNIITSHAAFGYLASSYGFKQIPITGLSPDAEPSSAELAKIIKFAKDNKIKYVFFESLTSPKLAKTIATEIGATTLPLNPLEGLSPEESAQEKNYLSLLRDNLTNLKIALQCSN